MTSPESLPSRQTRQGRAYSTTDKVISRSSSYSSSNSSMSKDYGDHTPLSISSAASETPISPQYMPVRTFNPMATAGPTPMHLLQNERSVFGHHSSSNASNTISSNKRGIAAAVALATAATIPFPLKKQNQNQSSKVQATHKEPTGKSKTPLPLTVENNKPVSACICGSSESKDGLFIQCNKCKTWQHKLCYAFKKSDPVKRDFVCKRCDTKTALQTGQAKPMIFPRKMGDQRLFQFSSIVTTSILHAEQQQRQMVNGSEAQSRKRHLECMTTPNITTKDNDSVRKKSKPEKVVVPGHFLKPLLNEITSSNDTEFKLITASKYKDKYVKMFIDSHYDDDWVVCSNWESFESVDIDIKKSSNGKDFGVFISKSCVKGQLIQEYLGEIDFQKNYLTNASNDYRLMGTTQPKVLFHPHWPLFIDSREVGGLTRYVRRSCEPNVELITVRPLNERPRGDSDCRVTFVLMATRDIKMGEEISLKWQWDLRNPIWELINASKDLDTLPDLDKFWLMGSIKTILTNCDCVCGYKGQNCPITKIKKFSEKFTKNTNETLSSKSYFNTIMDNCKKRDEF
ncbi:Set4p [Saccharomyces eubayanus]|uniref:Set4p n=1 Tax=Saccharomyces eubayanus TaxID=1080349 RepID=UPI0006C2AC84|nr:SET4-like protein [Saccharomyces eubayanus]KOG98505.1 SET4-like protein [Saccharomyces eubayanus]